MCRGWEREHTCTLYFPAFEGYIYNDFQITNDFQVHLNTKNNKGISHYVSYLFCTSVDKPLLCSPCTVCDWTMLQSTLQEAIQQKEEKKWKEREEYKKERERERERDRDRGRRRSRSRYGGGRRSGC